MKKVLLFVFMLAMSLYAVDTQKGRVRLVTVDTVGYAITVEFDSMAAGGTWDVGWTAYNDTSGLLKGYIYDTTWGFDSVFGAIRRPRMIYIGRAMKRPYPNQTEDSSVTTDSSVIFRMSLTGMPSGTIFKADSTHIKCIIKAGMYTAGGVSNLACTVDVINNSEAVIPKAQANWFITGYDRVVSNIILSAGGYQLFAGQGHPLACMMFVAADAHGDTVRDTVFNQTLIPTLCNYLTGYVCTLSTTALTQGDVITTHFYAVPRCGDTSTILRTDDGVNTAPSVLYCPLKFLCDKTLAYGRTVAVVDPVSGSDANGTAVDTANLATAVACSTIGRAINLIAAYNNTNHSRNNTCGGYVFCKAGDAYWLGYNTNGQGGTDCNLTITNYPGVAKGQFRILGYMTDKEPSVYRMKLKDLLIYDTTTGSNHLMFQGASSYYTFEGCDIHDILAQTNNWNQNILIVNAINCHIDSSYNGFQPYPDGSNVGLIRGCYFDTCNTIGKGHTVIGNTFIHYSSALSSALTEVLQASSSTHNNGSIIAFNKFLNLYQPAMQMGTAYDMSLAFAIIGNIMEYSKQNGAGPVLTIAQERKIIGANVWYNTEWGERTNEFYNSTGTEYVPIRYCTRKGNLEADHNIKESSFPTSDHARTGNHENYYGVNQSGNIDAEITSVAASGSFLDTFSGIHSIHFHTPSDSNYMKFTADKSRTGDHLGCGDYTLQASSPACTAAIEWLLPWDLNGQQRGPYGATGKMASGACAYGESNGSDMSAKCTITVAAGAGGTVNPSGAQIDTCGDSLKIVALPSVGRRFSHWDTTYSQKVNIRDPLNDTTWVSKIDSTNATVAARFDTVRYTLVVTRGTGDGTYDSAEAVAIAYDACGADSEFYAWELLTGTGEFNGDSTTFAPWSDATIRANYQIKIPAITPSMAAQVCSTTVAMTPITETNTGGPGAFAVTPALPGGISISSTTGTISGTPTELAAETEYKVICSNTTGKDTSLVTLTVVVGKPKIAYVSQSWSLQLGATTGRDSCISTGGALDSVDVDTLPPGILLDSTSWAFYVDSLSDTGHWTCISTAWNASGGHADTVSIVVSSSSNFGATAIGITLLAFGLGYGARRVYGKMKTKTR